MERLTSRDKNGVVEIGLNYMPSDTENFMEEMVRKICDVANKLAAYEQH